MKLFYAYAREDTAVRSSLHKHLVSLRLTHSIDEWFDGEIEPGTDWDSAIRKELEAADIILLLISAGFLDSPYASGVEMRRAFERQAEGRACVVPIFARPVHLRDHPLLKLQGLPRNGIPIRQWANEDLAYVSIAEELDELVRDLSGKQARRTKPLSVTDVLLRIPRPPVVSYVRRQDVFGRDLVERLVDELSPQRRQLVAIWGGGGVGKTTVAAEVVRTLVNLFEGRIAWVSSDGRIDLTLDLVVEEIASQLSYEAAPRANVERQDRATDVGKFVSSWPALIVLDNFETIQPEEQKRCLEWLSAKARCPALITSRQNVPNARNTPLGAMRDVEAQQYLAGLVEQSQYFSVMASLGADEIIRISEANPLLLQWITGQINLAQDPSEVVHELRRGEGDAAKRVFDRSFNLPQTGEDGRAVLLAVSLFAAPASRPALTSVAGFDARTSRTNDAISRLASLRLIDLAGDPSRLRIQGLTREHAQAKLLKRGDERAFRERFVEYFVSLCNGHDDATPENYDILEPEAENLQKAVSLACDLENPEAVFSISGAVAGSATGVLVARGRWRDAVEMNQTALNLAKRTRDAGAIQFFGHNLGAIWASQDELHEARGPLGESLAAAEANSSPYFVAATLFELANLEYKDHRLDSAGTLYRRSMELASANDNLAVLANCLHQLGLLATRRGDFEEAKDLLLQSLRIKQSQPESVSLALTLHELGGIAEVTGNLSEAITAYDFALRILERFGSPLSDMSRRALARIRLADGPRTIQ